jgi:hypothetical protein
MPRLVNFCTKLFSLFYFFLFYLFLKRKHAFSILNLALLVKVRLRSCRTQRGSLVSVASPCCDVCVGPLFSPLRWVASLGSAFEVMCVLADQPPISQQEAGPLASAIPASTNAPGNLGDGYGESVGNRCV